MRKALSLSFLVLCGCNFESRPLAITTRDGGAPVWAPANRAGTSAAESGAAVAQYTPAATAVGMPPTAADAGAPVSSAPAEPAAPVPDAAVGTADAVDQDAGETNPDAGAAIPPASPGAPMPSGKQLVEQLIEAVNALFDPGARGGKPNANTELKQWRMLARRSGALTAQVVSQALGAIEQRGACFARPEACVSVCAVIEESCAACAADASCQASLARVCGPTLASCPAQPAP